MTEEMTMVTFQSQKLAKPMIFASILLFLVQIVAALVVGIYSMAPHSMSSIVNFNVARAFHLNSLLLWVFMATFAAFLYVAPILGGRNLPRFTKVVPAYMAAVAVGILATLPFFQSGYNIWALDQPILIEGRELVEAGRIWDVLLLVGFVVFAVSVKMTLPISKKWNMAIWAMVLGAVGVIVMYIPGNIFIADLPLGEFFRWWTVHYWVELTLEVAFIGAVGLVLIIMIPDEKVKGIVEKYVFFGAALAVTSGIIGQGHHYFWIGTPTFWILLGGVVSVLEVVPLTLMIVETYRVASRLEIRNKASFRHLTGFAALGFTGAAMFGLTQTWPWTNWWEHGTWVTAAHAHIAMLAFGFGAISLVYFAAPDLGERQPDKIFERHGRSGFWFLMVGMAIQAFVFAFGGIVEIFHYRVLGDSWQDVFAVRAVPGLFLGLSWTLIFIGFLLYAGIILRELYIPEGYETKKGSLAVATARAFFALSSALMKALSGFSGVSKRMEGRLSKVRYLNTLEGFYLLVILALVFSAVATTGLWSFSASSVTEEHDPTLPYVLGLVGYFGMSFVAVLIALKLVRGVGIRGGE